MKRIFKYIITDDPKDRPRVPINNFNILTVEKQNGEYVLYVEVDDPLDIGYMELDVIVLGTGYDVPDDYIYIKTIMGFLVAHFYWRPIFIESTSPETGAVVDTEK